MNNFTFDSVNAFQNPLDSDMERNDYNRRRAQALCATFLYDVDPGSKQLVDTNPDVRAYAHPTMRTNENMHIIGRELALVADTPYADMPMELARRAVERVTDESRRERLREALALIGRDGNDTADSYYGFYAQVQRDTVRAAYDAHVSRLAERRDALTGLFGDIVAEAQPFSVSNENWRAFHDGLGRGVYTDEDEAALNKAVDAWSMMMGMAREYTDASANVLADAAGGRLIMDRLRGDELAEALFFNQLQKYVQDQRTSEADRNFFVRFWHAFEAADKTLLAGMFGGGFRAFVTDDQVEDYNREWERAREISRLENPNVPFYAEGDNWAEKYLGLQNARLGDVLRAARASGQLNEDGSLRKMTEEERRSTQELNAFRGKLYNATQGMYDIDGFAAKFGKMLPDSMIYLVPGGIFASAGSMYTRELAQRMGEGASWTEASNQAVVNSAIQATVERIAFGSLKPGRMVRGMDWLMSRQFMARSLGGFYSTTGGRIAMGMGLGTVEETFAEPLAALLLGGVYNTVASKAMQLDNPYNTFVNEMEEMLSPDLLMATALYSLLLMGGSYGGQKAAAENYRQVRDKLIAIGVDEGRAAQVARMENPQERMVAAQALIQERLKSDAGSVLSYVAELYPQMQGMATFENYFDKGQLPRLIPAGDGQVRVQEREADGTVTETVVAETTGRALVEARLEQLSGKEQLEFADMVLANAMVGSLSKDGERWVVSPEGQKMNHEYFQRLARAAGLRLSEGARPEDVDPEVHPHIPLGQLAQQGEAWEARMKVARHDYEQKKGKPVSDEEWGRVSKRFESRVNRTGVRGADKRLRTVLRVARGKFGAMEVLEDVTEDNLVRDMEANGRSLDYYIHNLRELEGALGKPGAFLRDLKDGETEGDRRMAVIEAMGKLVQSKVLADTASKGNGLSAALNAFLEMIRSWVLQAKAMFKMGQLVNKVLTDKEAAEKLDKEFREDVDRLVAQDVEFLQELQLADGLEAMQRVEAAHKAAAADRRVKRRLRAHTPVLDAAEEKHGEDVRKEQAEKEKTQAEVQADVEAAEAAVDGDFTSSVVNEEELEDIKAAAEKDGTFMKAPNGKPTNLTELQWLQVRTKAFKDWFGDWEKVARFNSAVHQLSRMSDVASITGTEFAPDGRKLTDKVTEFWNKEYGGVAKNPVLGDVVLDTRSVKASIAHGVGRLKSAAFAVVHDVIERGVLVEIAPDWKGRGEDSYVIAAPVQIGNAAYVCEVVVMKGETRTGFYLHEVQIKEKLLDVFKTGVVTGTSGASKSILLDVWQRVKQIEENCSKVVDENGEPRVVYHGSLQWFQIFNDGNERHQSGAPDGTIFANDNREIAVSFVDYYGGNAENVILNANDARHARMPWGVYRKGGIYPLFMNLKNPLVVDFEGLTWHGEKYDIKDVNWYAVEARKKGHDGLIIRNVIDVGFTDTNDVPPSTDYVAFESNQVKSATDNRGTFDGSSGDITMSVNEPLEGDVSFSVRTKAEPKKKGIGYKVFYQKDGKLYPPMVANPGGEDTPVGVWLDADEGVRAGESKTDRPQVKAGGKGTQGGSGTLAYRPGWHLGKIPYALQFNRKNPVTGEKDLFPNDFVWAEVEYAADVDYQEEAMSYGVNKNGKFQHSLAGLPKLPTDGYYEYRTNPNPATDPWIITGAMKVTKVLTRAEVDELVRAAGREPQKVEGDDVQGVSFNVIGPSAANWGKIKHRAFKGRDDGKERVELDSSKAKMKKAPLHRMDDSLVRDIEARLKLFREQLEQHGRWGAVLADWSKGVYKVDTWDEQNYMRQMLRGAGLEFPTLARMGELGVFALGLDGSAASAKKILKAGVMKNVVGYNRLGEVLDFPALFESYPELKKLPVWWMNDNFRMRGAYVISNRDGMNRIMVRANRSEGGKLSTLLHEVQHWIQHKEGFAYGSAPGGAVEFLRRMGNPEAYSPKGKQYRRFAGEIESRNVQARRWLAEAEREELPFNETLEYPGEAISYTVEDMMTFNVIGPSSANWDKIKHRAFRGRDDGMLRVEIDASESEVNVQALEELATMEEAMPLGKLLHYPSLYEAYPRLKDLAVYARDLGEWVNGYKSAPGDGEHIVINVLRFSNVAQVRNTLLHEVQHGIQDIEGYARGGSVDSARGELNALSRSPLKDFQMKVAESTLLWLNAEKIYKPKLKEYKDALQGGADSAQLERMRKELNDLATDLNIQYVNTKGYKNYWGDSAFELPYLGGTDAVFLEFVERRLAKMKSRKRAFPGLEKKMKARLQQMQHEFELAEKLDKLSDFELYLRLAGEIEARNVERRVHGTMEQREGLPFNDSLEYPGEALVTFSVSPTLMADIRSAAYNKMDSKAHVRLCSMPTVLRMLGEPEGDVYTLPGTISKLVYTHNLAHPEVYRAVEELDDPLFVYQETGKTCVFVLEMEATNNKGVKSNVMVAIELERSDSGHYLMSAYPLDALAKIKDLQKQGRLVYSKYTAQELEDAINKQAIPPADNAPSPFKLDLMRSAVKDGLPPTVPTKVDLVKYKDENFDFSASMVNLDEQALASEVVAAGQGFRANLAFSEQIVREMRGALLRMKKLGSKTATEREDAIAAMGTMVQVVKAAVAYLPQGYRFSVHPYLNKLEVLAELATTGDLKMTRDMANKTIKEWLKLNQGIDDVVAVKGQELDRQTSAEDLAKEYGEMQLQEAMETIMHRVAGQLRKHAKDRAVLKIKELVERLAPKKDPKTGKLKGGKMSADAYRDLEDVAKAMNMDAEELEAKLAALRAEMEKPGLDEERRAQLESEMTLYDQFGDLKSMSAEEAVEALEALRQRVWFHRFEWDNVQAERRAARRAMVRSVVDGVGDVGQNEYNAKKRAKKPTQRLKNLADILSGMPAVLTGLRGYLPLHKLADDLARRANRAGEAIKKWEAERWVALEALSRETLGKSWRKSMDFMHEVLPTGVTFNRPKYRSVSVKTAALRELLAMTPEERQAEMNRREKAGGLEAESVLTERDIEALEARLLAMEEAGKVLSTVEALYVEKVQREENLRLSRGEALYAILMWEQPTYTERMEAQGYTPEVIAGFKRFIGDGMLQFGYGLREQFARQGERIARVYEATFGVPFTREENYFAARWNVTGMKENSAEQLLAGMAGTPGAGNGWMKQRVKHNLELDMTKDALQVFLQATTLTDTWMATQDIVADFKAWTRDPDFDRAMNSVLGKDDYENLKDWIRIVEQGGVQDCLNMGVAQDVINGLYGSGAVAILGFRIQTLIRQLPSIFNGLLGAHDISTGEWIATLSRMKKAEAPMTYKRMMNSTLIQNRRQGKAGNMAGQAMRSNDTASSMTEGMLLASMLPMEWVDASATAMSLVPVWNVYYQRAIDKGASVQEAEQAAWEQTTIVANLSAQPIGWLNRSKIAQSRNPLVKAVFYMLSENTAKYAMCRALWRGGKKAAAVRAWLIYGAANAAISALLDFLQGDPEEWEKGNWWEYMLSAFYGPMASIPGVGEMLEGLGTVGLNVAGEALDVEWMKRARMRASVGRALIDVQGSWRAVRKLYEFMTDNKEHSLAEYTRAISTVSKTAAISTGWLGNSIGFWSTTVAVLMNPIDFGARVWRNMKHYFD